MRVTPGKKIYFLSDLHLGYRQGAEELERERRVVRFLQKISRDASEVYLLGDVLDFWYEYRMVVPRGFVRFFGQLAAMTDAGVRVVWIAGNHDIWLFDYLREELGVEVCPAGENGFFRTLDGKHFFLSHGDRLGKLPWTMRFIGGVFRNKVCQSLFSAIHPRWGVGLAHKWSHHSGRYTRVPDSLAPHVRARVELFCRQLVSEHPELDYIIMGHHHVALEEPVGAHCRLIILGEWFRRNTYAVLEDGTLRLCSWHG